MLDPSTTPQKAVFLYGPSRSGKGTYLRLMNSVAGARNVSSVNLHQLVSSRFMCATVYGKILNSSGDLSAAHVEDLSTLKQMTGEYTISADLKDGGTFEFTNRALFAFAANEILTVAETRRELSRSGSSRSASIAASPAAGYCLALGDHLGPGLAVNHMALALAVVALAEIDRVNPFAGRGALIDAAFASHVVCSCSFRLHLSLARLPRGGRSQRKRRQQHDQDRRSPMASSLLRSDNPKQQRRSTRIRHTPPSHASVIPLSQHATRRARVVAALQPDPLQSIHCRRRPDLGSPRE